jgi:hypothetical protein
MGRMPFPVETSGVRSTPVDVYRLSPPADYSVEVLREAAGILRAEAELAALRESTGQGDNPLLETKFFLGRVRLFPGNRPVVLLIRCTASLVGAILLYEKTVCGVPTGYLRGFDHMTGESSVIAQEPVRASLLQLAIHQLFLKTGARVAWATVCQKAPALLAGSAKELDYQRIETGSLGREHRLKLGPTFAATLNRFGSHTRRNLRYYRRRAENEINAAFQAELSTEESNQAFEQLKSSSFQPFRVSLAEWRKIDGLMRTQPGYFAVGLRANGQWISYLAGMRAGKLTYVLMQMNHTGFARYSLSTVLRSYFFEYETERGQEEIKFVNGTCALYQQCCELDTCFTVSASRGLIAFVLSRWIAPLHYAPDHALNMQRWTALPAPPSKG